MHANISQRSRESVVERTYEPDSIVRVDRDDAGTNTHQNGVSLGKISVFHTAGGASTAGRHSDDFASRGQGGSDRRIAMAVADTKRAALYSEHAALSTRVALGKASASEKNRFQLLSWQLDQDETARMSADFDAMEQITQRLEALAESVSSTVDAIRPGFRVKSTNRVARLGRRL